VAGHGERRDDIDPHCALWGTHHPYQPAPRRPPL
jgi:hypothetical protein